MLQQENAILRDQVAHLQQTIDHLQDHAHHQQPYEALLHLLADYSYAIRVDRDGSFTYEWGHRSKTGFASVTGVVD